MLQWCSGLAYTHIMYTYANILILYAYQILEEGAHLTYNYNGRVNQLIYIRKIYIISSRISVGRAWV